MLAKINEAKPKSINKNKKPAGRPATGNSNSNELLSTMKAIIKISFDGCREIEVDTKTSDTVADVIAKIRTQEDMDRDVQLNLFCHSHLLNESDKISDFVVSSNGRMHPLTLTTLGPAERYRSMLIFIQTVAK